MVRLPVLTLMLAAFSVSLSAQTVPERMASTKSQVFVGYSYLLRDYRHTQLNPVSGGMNGWTVEYDRPRLFGNHLGLAVSVSGHYGTSGPFTPQLTSATAGPQYSFLQGRSSAFVHGLVGVIVASGDVIAQTSATTIVSTSVGGGFERLINPRLGWRVNGDWIHGGFQTNDTNQISDIVKNNFSISSGPVLRF